MNQHITIERRFCGPPTSGNGGYSCGMLANFTDYPAEVTLFIPPPLEMPLTVKSEGDGFALLHGDALVARAVAKSLNMQVPEPPTWEEAKGSIACTAMLEKHAFPSCFVCGPDRDEGDGLRIFAGTIPNRDYVATQWIPDSTLTSDEGLVREEIICAALDCPGAWAVSPESDKVIVLGRLAVDIVGKIRAGEPCIAMGWKIGQEGRKLFAGTAVFSATGQLFARAKATWIELKAS